MNQPYVIEYIKILFTCGNTLYTIRWEKQKACLRIQQPLDLHVYSFLSAYCFCAAFLPSCKIEEFVYKQISISGNIE